jgi:hypothetical protein
MVIGSFSMGGRTLINVLAVYFGAYLIKRYHAAPPTIKPNIVKQIISHTCRRNIAKISFGVSGAGMAAGLAPAGRGIALGDICLSSAIIFFN